MATYVTLRPAMDRYNDSLWNDIPWGATRWQIMRDNDDATYIFSGSDNISQAFYFDGYTLPANTRCSGVRTGTRFQSHSSGFRINFDAWIRHGDGADGGVTNYNGVYGITQVWGNWYAREFTQNDLGFFEGWWRHNNGDTATQIIETYAELRIQTKPTVTVTGPGAHGSLGHSVTPTITWNANYQGDTPSHFIVHIRRVSDSVLVHDSGWVAGSPGQYTVPAGVLQPGVQYAAILNVSTDFLGTAWWSDWSAWHHFTTDPVPTTTVTAPVGDVTDTNRPTITWTYATSAAAQNGWHYKIFTADEVTQPGFDPATWIPITSASGTGAVLSRQVTAPLAPNVPLKAFSRVQSSVSGWSAWSAAGPTFTVTASGLDKPSRVFFAYSGGYNLGIGYYEFDDSKREGSYTWKSAPFRDPSGTRQIEIREVQLYVQTYDALSYLTVTVGGTERTVTFPVPGRHHCSLLFNERGEMLDVTVFASAATPATNEAPTIEAIRIGTKSGHLLR